MKSAVWSLGPPPSPGQGGGSGLMVPIRLSSPGGHPQPL